MSTIKVEFSHEVKVGIFATISAFVLYFGYNFLKGIDIFSNQNTFYVEYPSAADLQVSNNVTINGYIVGRVSSMELLQNQNNMVKVTLDINEDIKVYKNTVAIIADKGMLGDKQIILRTEGEGELAPPETTLAGGVENGMVAAIVDKLDPLFASLEATLDTAKGMMSQFRVAGATADSTLMSAKSIMRKVDNGGLDKTLYNLQVMSSEFSAASKKLEPILAKMDHLADSLNDAPLAQTVKEAQQLLASANTTLQNVNDPNGTVGALLTERELHDQMVRTMADLDSLFIDFQEHPKRYIHFSVFGKKDKAPKEKKKK
ncbi:MlaD family protein [Flammeovirga aprica]|uniref:MCE family protein n=1 Tax=Flammeovirga aprica JL-4 TaxID=694437 RepID=A0A7X9X9M5_9BACT|nr:MlaD family protein [Flammeovirga aprica]NME68952.1 MCE family protein [Flammeovirga aprica JL-4]